MLTNAQTRLTIVTRMQPAPISKVHSIVLAILVILGMEHIAKVSLHKSKQSTYSSVTGRIRLAV